MQYKEWDRGEKIGYKREAQKETDVQRG